MSIPFATSDLGRFVFARISSLIYPNLILDGFVSRERHKQGTISLLSRHVSNNKCFPTKKKTHKSYNCKGSRDLIKLRRLKRIGLVITASDTRGVEMT